MTTIYYEKDADAGMLAAETVAVVGYGNQGRSWALNLRDGGYEPVVCVRADASLEQAADDGFSVHEVSEAGGADVICILVPDDVVPLLDLRPGRNSCVIVASGYTLAFGRLDPPGDSGIVAPRMLGPEYVGAMRKVSGSSPRSVCTAIPPAVLSGECSQSPTPSVASGREPLSCHRGRRQCWTLGSSRCCPRRLQQ
jgi:ketol-acid reductoisomerase